MPTMAVASIRPEELHTRGARVLAQFLPLHEEHAPLGFGARVEDAMLRVGSHVGDAARLTGDSPLLVAVPLSWAAAAALAAIPRLGDTEDAGVLAKDALLMRVDRAVAALPESGASAAELVAAVTAPLGSALATLAEPEGADDAAAALFELVVAAVTAVVQLERRAAHLAHH